MANTTDERPVLSWRGRPITSDLLVELYAKGAKALENRTNRIKLCQGLRRKTITVRLNAEWVKKNPELAEYVVSVMPERQTWERNVEARAGAVEPVYSRAALGELESDTRDAEQCENYINQWRLRGVPYQMFQKKGTEDGEYAVTVLPTDVGMQGEPDFFDRLSERAYAKLKPDEQQAYRRDPSNGRGRRYYRADADGNKVPHPKWDRDAKGRPRKAVESKGESFVRDTEKSEEAHAEAVRRYLLKRDASEVRLIPALECVPYFVRGTGRNRWELVALIERTLWEPIEIEAHYGWRGMGNRLLIPRENETNQYGENGQFYLYTAYLCSKDDDGIERPLLCYSACGKGTWWSDEAPPEDADSAVAVIDLYKTHGLEGAFWHYGRGMTTGDDSPDWASQPAMWPLADRILQIEGLETAISAATAVNAYTGYWHQPNPDLLDRDDEALVDAATRELIHPTMPKPGEIETSLGAVTPAQQATVSPDAKYLQQSYLESLRLNSTDDAAAPGRDASGNALLVGDTLAKNAKRDIRDGALESVIFCGESHLKILHAYERKYHIRWPQAVVTERAPDAERDTAGAPLEFDPAWVGDDDPNYSLSADYTLEPQLALADLFMNAAERGFTSDKKVQYYLGESDVFASRVDRLEDQLYRMPEKVAEFAMRVAKARGDEIALKALRLRQQNELGGPTPIAGFENGVPTAVLQNGPGRQSKASQVRGGVMSGQIGASTAQANAQAEFGGAAPGAAA